jgi:hypothetical protein
VRFKVLTARKMKMAIVRECRLVVVMRWDRRLSTAAVGLLYYSLGDSDVNQWTNEILICLPLRCVSYWIGKILFPSSIPLTCLRCLCWYDCQRALVDESGVIPSRHHRHHSSPCSHITRGMNNRPVDGRSSET